MYVLKSSRGTPFENDKKTLDALCNIGTIYTWLGMNDEALESYKECYNLSRKVLGKDHPDTLTIKDYIDSMPVQLDVK